MADPVGNSGAVRIIMLLNGSPEGQILMELFGLAQRALSLLASRN
jgi:hypothetical protein